jgi:hypothetical protein
MPTNCENCKGNPVDIARNTQGTPTAKLIAILEAFGIISAADLAEIVGISDRAIRKSRNSGSGTQVPPGTTGPEPQDRHGTTVPKTELQDRNSGSALARATKESSSKISFTTEVSNSPPTPSTAKIEAREGEEDVGFGVMVNCKTIRHPSFTINVDGVRMTTLSSGLDANAIKEFCLGMALQWATEIDAGGEPRKVLPDRIPNFLSASIMGGKVRADVGEIRRSKASAMPERKRLDLSKIQTYDCEPVA